MSAKWTGKLEKLDENRFLIPKESVQGMKVDGIIYSDEKLKQHLLEDNTPLQVSNVAFLPGIVKYSLAMPDIHWGYGFPIGGVAAIDPETGVVSPGGVGYDINCGVRLMASNLSEKEVKQNLKKLTELLFNNIPCGVGEGGKINLGKKELIQVCSEGSKWAVKKGYGWNEDPEFTEEEGQLKDVSCERITDHAFKRGRDQVGTLGSGNHFLEIQKVQKIFDEEAARIFGVREGMITVMIHSGSRGFGYQVCADSLQFMRNAPEKYGFTIPDKQLACAPVNSPEGKDYLGEMNAAVNYAWANRQVIMHLIRETLEEVFNKNAEDMGLRLIYDIAN
ncbi:MAG: RtcB family protein, partial [bacterium]|nr:RtcB family protein [bacterium]